MLSTILKDPVTGIGSWNNNKASACLSGIAMDHTVKDQEPDEIDSNPQFSRTTNDYKVSH